MSAIDGQNKNIKSLEKIKPQILNFNIILKTNKLRKIMYEFKHLANILKYKIVLISRTNIIDYIIDFVIQKACTIIYPLKKYKIKP